MPLGEAFVPQTICSSETLRAVRSKAKFGAPVAVSPRALVDVLFVFAVRAASAQRKKA